MHKARRDLNAERLSYNRQKSDLVVTAAPRPTVKLPPAIDFRASSGTSLATVSPGCRRGRKRKVPTTTLQAAGDGFTLWKRLQIFHFMHKCHLTEGLVV